MFLCKSLPPLKSSIRISHPITTCYNAQICTLSMNKPLIGPIIQNQIGIHIDPKVQRIWVGISWYLWQVLYIFMIVVALHLYWSYKNQYNFTGPLPLIDVIYFLLSRKFEKNIIVFAGTLSACFFMIFRLATFETILSTVYMN